ncbi:acyl-CoA-dependent ceramide synthase [Rhizodiscina lignyota]|uniref:Acyl-CoA-dependent ceramide synthase n=1 Tax=Rhizodiscina lignyota TaxID=1504668 RepID=A0A9P4INX8_9PEZI|nr:acyl-CoA-dependent ceramide synthase [Rhizodiscina lignyota]
MSKRSAEPFPAVASAPAHENNSKSQPNGTRRRRKSSGLGGEPRGDTAAPAFATTANRLDLQPLSSAPSPRSTDKSGRRSKRKKMKSLFRRWKSISFRHTWLNPLIIALIVLACFAVNPTPSNPVYPALALSYPLPRKPGDSPDAPIQYGKGIHDFTFVAYYIVVLSFTREFLMQRLIRPLAIKAGIRSRAKQSRFMEQLYTAIYFAVFGPFGLYVMSRTPVWYFNTPGMYESAPHHTHEAVFKAYYLLQAAYWAQQMIVLLLMLEKPRKDFKELVAHHIITVSLIWLSYRFHFTYMGVAVYITHDISDFFLATSKTINYLDWPIVGPYFFFFILVWTYLRHYINLQIIFSIQFATVGPYDLNWITQQYKCWISQFITFGLLAALQAVNLVWLFFILRIAWRYIRTGEERDDRSEPESEEEDVAAPDTKSPQANQSQKSDTPTMLLNGTPLASGILGDLVR